MWVASGLVSSFSLSVPITKLTMVSGDSFAGVDESEKGICLIDVIKLDSVKLPSEDTKKIDPKLFRSFDFK